jgi:hypothetical protein
MDDIVDVIENSFERFALGDVGDDNSLNIRSMLGIAFFHHVLLLWLSDTETNTIACFKCLMNDLSTDKAGASSDEDKRLGHDIARMRNDDCNVSSGVGATFYDLYTLRILFEASRMCYSQRLGMHSKTAISLIQPNWILRHGGWHHAYVCQHASE